MNKMSKKEKEFKEQNVSDKERGDKLAKRKKCSPESRRSKSGKTCRRSSTARKKPKTSIGKFKWW